MTLAINLDSLVNTKEGLKAKLNLGNEVPFSNYINYINLPTITHLFKDDKQGVIYDPSDITTLYQNSTGTIPVTKDGDPIGLVLDKSQGLKLGPELFPNAISIGVGWFDNGDGSYTCDGSQTTPTDISDYTLYNTIVNKASTYTRIDVNYAPDTVSTTAYAYAFHPSPTNSSLKEGINTRIGTDNNTFVIRAPVGVKLTVKVSVKELKGNHSKQTLSSARPLYQSGDSRGLVNILYPTEDLNSTRWGRANCTVEVVNDILPPIEGVVVNKVTAITNTGTTRISQGYNSTSAPLSYSSSVYVKAGTYSHVRLSPSQAANAGSSVTLNLVTGVYSHRQGTNPLLSHNVESVGDGWYRITINNSNSTYNLNHFVLYLTSYYGSSDSGAGIAGYIPNAGDYIYMSAPQYERLPLNTSNIKTSAYQINGSYLGGIGTDKFSDIRWMFLDKVDDATLVTIPTGGWVGTMVIASSAGTASYGVSIPEGSYKLGGYFPTNNLIGAVIRNGALTTEEKTDVENYYTDRGAAKSFGKLTSFTNFWRGKTEITSFPLIDTSNATSLVTTWYGCSSLTSFPQIDTSKTVNISNSWYGCSALTSFPLIDTSTGVDFTAAWDGCSSLISFPLIDTSKGTLFTATWRNCASLTSFPLIDTSKNTNFHMTWFGCTSLTNFPLVSIVGATTISSTWQNCTGLISFPLINTSNITSMKQVWQNCNSLTTFPLIDTSKVTNLMQTWYECYSLTSFPMINTSSVTDMSYTWQSCTGLTSFPWLDTSNVLNIAQAWFNCFSLVNFPSNMFDNVKTGNFNNTFGNTNLSQVSIDNILTSLVTSGIATGTRVFKQSGGSAPSIEGTAAIDTLRSRGWVVTVTGGY